MPIALRSQSHRRRTSAEDEPAAPWYDPLDEGLDVVAAYRPLGAASYAASLENEDDPGTRDAVPVSGAPDWTGASGWIGKTGCSGLEVGDGYTTAGQNYTVIARVVAAAAYQPIAGANTTGFQIRGHATGTHTYCVSGQTPGPLAGATGVLGLSAFYPPSTQAGYKDGASEATNWTLLTVANGLLLRCGPTSSPTWSVQAVVWYAQGLTPTQHLAIAAAMAALTA